MSTADVPICEVYRTRGFEKQAKKLPAHIQGAIATWIDAVENEGIFEVRKVKGYHDEPLRGDRSGQRSIRLNRDYRLIYEEDSRGAITIIILLEANKHDY